MIEKTVEISLPLLLPENQDACDHCEERLQTRLQAQRGILQTHLHLDHDPMDLCIHYDPNLISFAAVKRIAKEAGSELRNGYHHEQIPFSGLDSADSATMITKELENLEGMLHASVSYASGLVIVAFDTKILSLDSIKRTMRRLGARPVTQAMVKEEGEAHEHDHEHDHGSFRLVTAVVHQHHPDRNSQDFLFLFICKVDALHGLNTTCSLGTGHGFIDTNHNFGWLGGLSRFWGASSKQSAEDNQRYQQADKLLELHSRSS
ncbi:MAG TPA: heavy-metal-associated domain-containing protein [Anaerolineaceae bacterium]|nr:heavy-metal-associated domain-containing protein [Anaerolineaceae bacterium]